MRFEGVLPEDAPDPRIENAKRLKLMPIPIMGLVPQPTLEDPDMIGFQYGQDSRGYNEMSASITYMLWRNPVDKSDPINLAELDEQTRASIGFVPPWPRPQWLVEQVERLRYPQLWEAVRTTWHRDPTGQSSVAWVLTDHLIHILMNRNRRQWIGGNAWDPHTRNARNAPATREVAVQVDGAEVRGIEIDTDPVVYAVGASLGNNGVVTAVLPREELNYIRIEFAKRGRSTGFS
ncbi:MULTISPECIES: hypothetical protein [Arthrobacter]|uniref:Uncharacterized protein n=1 Tax=Arthrobacter terricola TaxID=2547396 RepID=A0A4R5KC40_9MICC|nr:MULTISPECIES: hypothetical protein [Arthrobacter]MBT8161767.1 hypothetical protein [Arthrobacter sp. GN70]TDF92666.1 hypothetical protein E1809_17595 [Arthrobacter terricola]